MRGDICLSRGCSICCHDTEMLLTKEDVKRLADAGYEDFLDPEEEGGTLRNVDGRCVFLDKDGICKVYGIRPMGCRIYPLVMRMPERIPILDPLCPYNGEFNIEPEDVAVLDRIVEELI